MRAFPAIAHRVSRVTRKSYPLLARHATSPPTPILTPSDSLSAAYAQKDAVLLGRPVSPGHETRAIRAAPSIRPTRENPVKRLRWVRRVRRGKGESGQGEGLEGWAMGEAKKLISENADYKSDAEIIAEAQAYVKGVFAPLWTRIEAQDREFEELGRERLLSKREDLLHDSMENLDRLLVYCGTYVCSEDTQQLLAEYREKPMGENMVMERYELGVRLRAAALRVAREVETSGHSKLMSKLPARSAKILLPISRLYRALRRHCGQPSPWEEAWDRYISPDTFTRFLQNPGTYLNNLSKDDLPAITLSERRDVMSELEELRNLDGSEMGCLI